MSAEDGWIILNKAFAACYSSILHSYKALFLDVTQAFNADMTFLLEIDESGDYHIYKDFCYYPDQLYESFHLKQNSILITKLVAAEGKILPVNPHEIDEYVEIKDFGLKGFIAAHFVPKDNKQKILFIGSIREQVEGASHHHLLFKSQDKKLINYAISKLSKIFLQIYFKILLEKSNYDLFKNALMECEDSNILLLVAKDLCMRKTEYIDAIIILLERGLDLNSKAHDIIEMYETEIIPFFETYLSNPDNLPITKESSASWLELSHPFLLSYFLYKINKDLLKVEDLFKKYTLEERVTLFKSIGRAINFCFYRQKARMENNEDKKHFLKFEWKNYELEKYIESVSFLIGEYACTVLGLERHFNIENHIRCFISSQAVLYSLKNNYRDHLFHMIDICFFGFFLLNNRIVSNKSFLDLIVENTDSDIKDRNRLLRNWFIASLFHDIGCAMDLYDSIQSEIQFIHAPHIDELKKNIAETYKREVFNFNINIYVDLLTKIANAEDVKKLSKLDHGVVSAAHLINIIEENFHNKQKTISYYLPSIQAIINHNLFERDISLKKYPISALLALCDELQDWERPTIESLTLKEKLAAAIQFRSPFSLSSNSLLEVIHVQVESDFHPFSDKGSLSKDSKLNLILDYSKAKKGKSFDPPFSWLIKSYKLQRLNLENIVTIKIDFINSIENGKSEFDELKNRRRKAKKWFFEHWIDLVEDSHSLIRNEKNVPLKERLSINIESLFEMKPLEKNPLFCLTELRPRD